MAGARFRAPAERIARSVFSGGLRFKRLIYRNPRLERLFYETVNRHQFGRLAVHDAMLADEVRNAVYARGIAANVGKDDVVLDLGTGVGLLACLAARQQPRKVYAIDHNSVDLARALAEANDLHGIDFRRIDSADFHSEEPVDVIVQEQIGTAVFNERMVSSVAALRDRVLRPGGRILPNRFDLYIEPAQLRQDNVMPLIWEHRVEGLDFTKLREIAHTEPAYPPPQGTASAAFERLLCDPEPVLSIDLERSGPAALPTRLSSSRQVVSAGVQHGLAVYFVAHFDATHRLTNAPLAPPTNWPPLLLRTETRKRHVGERIPVELAADSLERPETWRWAIDT